jgi:4-diphosphocytidyl-2-C-methyl-D-erythritol kinase
MTRAIVRAHAKINLNLRVLGRRPDGFHDLETLVQSISLHDTLEFYSHDDGIRLEVDDPGVPADPGNLVWQAAASLARAAPTPLGVGIRLGKRIPVGAGLGGGSSDAAATLIALNKIWSLGLSLADLALIAAELGSDVPFFLAGGTALLTGRGTEVRALPDVLGYRLVVVFPGVPLATREVYSQLQAPLTPMGKIGSMGPFGRIPDGEVESWVGLGNDLGPSARRLCPVIGEIEDRLKNSGATAAGMSGSGSAVFGLFRDRTRQEGAARDMRNAGWDARACEPIGRVEYAGSLSLA